MTNKSGKRILLFPDIINGNESGGHSARATLNYLERVGHNVAVYTRDASSARHPDISGDTILYQIPTEMRWYEHLYSPKLTENFKCVIDEFQPDYVLFAGGIQKPAVLGEELYRRKIRSAYLFYINDYFCPRIYAGTESGPCTECISKPIIAPFKNGCFAFSTIPKFVKTRIILDALGRQIKKADKFLGFGQDQLNIAGEFGVSQSKLAVVGFQFSPDDLIDLPVHDGDYFAITGQPIMQKGWHLLSSIFRLLKSKAKFKISFISNEFADQAISRYGLREYVDSGRVQITTVLSERSHYLDFLASSRGVVLPSYYPTTGEFVLQESMFLGKPIHVFNVGVHKDILIDRQNAMVSEVGDLEDYARKIDEVEQNSSLRRDLSIGIKETSKSFYSPSKIELLNKVFE